MLLIKSRRAPSAGKESDANNFLSVSTARPLPLLLRKRIS